MNYRAAVAVIRSERDRELVRIRAKTRCEIAEISRQRDLEIQRLRVAGLSMHAIAAEVGCSRGQVYEVLNPDRRAVYNERRRLRWRLIHGGKAAA